MRSKGSTNKRLKGMDNAILKVTKKKSLTIGEIQRHLERQGTIVTWRTLKLHLLKLKEEGKIVKEIFGENNNLRLWKKK